MHPVTSSVHGSTTYSIDLPGIHFELYFCVSSLKIYRVGLGKDEFAKDEIKSINIESVPRDLNEDVKRWLSTT